MGMYNEVYKSCPECGHKNIVQIPQIVLGFGNFDLDNKKSLEDLSINDLETLKEYLENEKFYCENCSFSYFYKEKSDQQKLMENLFD